MSRTVERGHRRAAVAILAVVVILDDHRAMRPRPLEQFPSSSRRKRDARRKLTRRRYIHESRPIAELAADQPFFIDAHRPQPRAAGLEHEARPEVTGVLERHLVAALEKEPRADIEPLLRAADHDDLLCGSRNASRARHILRDLFAQWQVALPVLGVVER